MESRTEGGYVRGVKTIPFFAGIFALALALSGCNQTAVPAGKADFAAQLSGGEQVPPVMTAASGAASFWLDPDGTKLHYKLSVSELNQVTMAHLHLGAVGKNGSPVVWLYPPAPPAEEIDGASNGVLSEGVITADNLAGPLKGKTVADLVAAIRAQNIYVNVHTRDHPDGEIRGQVHVD
jgi:hypothetical protein